MTMTLKEIYQALLNDETLTDKDGNKVRIKDNKLVDENGIQSYVSFTNPELWEVYKDPKDPKNWIGKLCWFWGNVEEQKEVGILTTHYGCSGHFELNYDILYEHCRPLTREEVEQYLVKEN